MLAFMIIMPAVWIALHAYMGRRLLRGVDGKLRRWGWGAMATLALMPVFAFVIGRVATGPWMRPVQWVSFLLMGVGSLLFFGVLAIDLVRLGEKLTRRFRGPDAEIDPARRGFLAKTANLAIVGGTGSITGVGVVQARQMPQLVEVEVPIDGLPGALHGYTIAQISDVHVGPTIRGSFLEAVVEEVNGLGADMIAVTGDLIDGYVEDLAPEVASLGKLDARDGVYFVTGNHEYYWDGPAWCRHVAGLGLTVLNNEHLVIERDGATILLAGVTDHSAGGQVEGHGSDPHAARKGAPDCDLDILLAHQPRSVFEADKAGFDLQISGHTHGGQYFPMNIMARLAQPYLAGLERHGSTWIYVSRGTAYWGPPLRVAAPHEITLLRLVPA